MENEAIILVGDARDRLRDVPSESVRCCVTSPPYFGLRDYGVEGQIGLEETPEAFVARLVEVFREVRRVTRPDGTLWVNMGDSYARTGGSGGPGATARVGATKEGVQRRNCEPPSGYKSKDLIGVPWMLAFALRADGWFLRQDLIWSKPNPMPESVTDRCTKAHEYLFLLSKSPRYYFDHEAIREQTVTDDRPRSQRSERKAREPSRRGDPGVSGHVTGTATLASGTGRNRRSVWTITPKPFRGTHFATFPPDLVRPCVLAGSQPGDVVLDPFNGAGTTGLVALEEGRSYVGIELNPEYVEITRERLAAWSPVVDAAS